MELVLPTIWAFGAMVTACLAGLLVLRRDPKDAEEDRENRRLLRTGVVVAIFAWPLLLVLLFLGRCSAAWPRA